MSVGASSEHLGLPFDVLHHQETEGPAGLTVVSLERPSAACGGISSSCRTFDLFCRTGKEAEVGGGGEGGTWDNLGVYPGVLSFLGRHEADEAE